MSLKELFKRRPKEVLTDVCLYSGGKLKSPTSAEVGMLAYSLALSANGNADVLDEIREGETVSITVPIEIPYNTDKYGICCMLADTYTLAGVPREKGNNSGTIYTLGKKAKGYFADPLNLQPEEYRRLHQFYFQILDEIYGIPVDAKNHYDQIVLKHEELTGKPFLRDQALGDDGNWHGNIKQNEAEAEHGPGYGMNFGDIDKRGKQSYHNYAFWKFAKSNQTHNIGNATIIDLPKTLAFIEEFFRKTGGPGIADEDVDKATMSFAHLFTDRALEVSKKCSQLVYGEDYGAKESGIYTMLEALGYEEWKIEDALDVLSAEDDEHTTDRTKHDKRRDPAARKTDESDKPGKPSKPDKSQKDDGYEEDPDIKEGRLVSFKTVEMVIADIRAAADEAKGDKKAQLLTAILTLQDALSQVRINDMNNGCSDNKKEKVGARYLNWKLEQAEVLKIKLPNGKSVLFNEAKKN